MKNLLRVLLGFVAVCGLTDSIAQNRLSLSNRNPLFMDMRHNYNANGAKTEITDDTQWLNYTTLVNLSDPNLAITVQLGSGSLPEGMELYIEAMPYQGMSKLRHGNPVGRVRVSNVPQVLISNIGTGYTGSGRNEGYQLIYTLVTSDYSKISSGSFSFYVQFTITQ